MARGIQSPVDPQSLYNQLGHLIASMPDLTRGSPSPSDRQWLGKAYALVSEVGHSADAISLAKHTNYLAGDALRETSVQQITSILYRALAVAELRAPSPSQGAFIPAGSTFDAMAAVGKVLQTATSDALIVDPYMDEKALTDSLLFCLKSWPCGSWLTRGMSSHH